MEKKQILEKLMLLKSSISFIDIRSCDYESKANQLLKKKEYFESKVNEQVERISNHTRIIERIKNNIYLIEQEEKSINEKINSICNDKSEIDSTDWAFEKNDSPLIFEPIKKRMDEMVEKYNKRISTLEELKAQNQKMLQEIDFKDDPLVQESLIELKNKVMMILSYEKDCIDLMKKETNTFYNNLCSRFNDFLHYKDYDRIELIYYYIDTNRAKSISEALNLMDTQLRHEELKDTITLAVNSLSNAIETMNRDLKHTLNSNFEILYDSINEGFSTLHNDNKEILEKYDLIRDELKNIQSFQEEILSTNIASEALIRKQSETCESMLNHYKYVNGMTVNL